MRLAQYDILKGIAIIMMVAFHARDVHFIDQVGRLFHMAVFFILSGWFFDGVNFKSWLSFLHYAKKQLVRLWLPIVLCGGVFVVLHNQLIEWNLISELAADQYIDSSYCCPQWGVDEMTRQMLLAPSTFANYSQLAAAFWFLQSLLFVTIGYCGVSWGVSRVSGRVLVVQSIISLVIVLLGQYKCLPCVRYIGGEHTVTAYFLFHVGVVLKRYGLSVERLGVGMRSLVAVVSLLGLIILANFGSVSLAQNKFPNVLFLLTCSILGWYLLLAISLYLKRVSFLAYIGRHTMPIAW